MRSRLSGLLLAAFVLAAPWPAKSVENWHPPDPDALPDDPWGRAVRLGRDLTAATPMLIGPQAADPALRFAGNNLTCQSCHLNAGTAEFGLPYVGVYGDFPQYRGREGQVGSLEDRINGCMTRSMNGRALPIDGPEMRGFAAYIKFLSAGVPIGAPTKGRGTPELKLLDRPADPVHGAGLFLKTCAVCHGENGLGKRVEDTAEKKVYQFPPLWGADSFNDGAGMARLIAMAGFVHANMPFGTTWESPAMTVEDAWDVSAFVESQPRPHMSGLEGDYPNRKQKPVDAAYGPYSDGFSPAQHKFGPFQPIKDAVKPQK